MNYRLGLIRMETSDELNSVESIYGVEQYADIFVKRLGMLAYETLAVLCLDAYNKPISFSEIGIGGSDEVRVDYGHLFKVVLLSNARYFVIGHNHPARGKQPSENDLKITRKINSLANLFNITLLDSIIVTPEKEFVSIRTLVKENRK